MALTIIQGLKQVVDDNGLIDWTYIKSTPRLLRHFFRYGPKTLQAGKAKLVFYLIVSDWVQKNNQGEFEFYSGLFRLMDFDEGASCLCQCQCTCTCTCTCNCDHSKCIKG